MLTVLENQVLSLLSLILLTKEYFYMRYKKVRYNQEKIIFFLSFDAVIDISTERRKVQKTIKVKHVLKVRNLKFSWHKIGIHLYILGIRHQVQSLQLNRD